MTPYQMVREFHTLFNHLVRRHPTPLPKPERVTRIMFLWEEMMEFAQAEDIVAQADALADLLYFIYGTFVNIGVDPERVFTAVHEANMRKLWPDGKPRWREGDGKVIKPPDWIGPEDAIAAEIERQHHKANIALLQEVSQKWADRVVESLARDEDMRILGLPVTLDDSLPETEIKVGWEVFPLRNEKGGDNA